MKVPSTIIALLLLVTYVTAQPGNNVTEISSSLYVPVEKTVSFKIANRTIPVKVLQYGESRNLVCINLHSNEQTSVKAALSVLERKGGTLIKIENNGQRVIRFKLNGINYSFDPNRMFSKIGIQQTLLENSKPGKAAVEEIEKFAANVLSMIPDSASCVVALHNNTEQAFSIRSYMQGGNRQSDAKAVYADSLQDVDDLILTTDSLLYQKMADLGHNSILQDNEKAKKDGSLSIYFGEINRRYINIETQHGKVNQYVIMLEKLLTILAEDTIEITGLMNRPNQ